MAPMASQRERPDRLQALGFAWKAPTLAEVVEEHREVGDTYGPPLRPARAF